MKEIKQNMAEGKKKRARNESENRNLRVVIYCIPGRGADGVSLYSIRCGLGTIMRILLHVAYNKTREKTFTGKLEEAVMS